MLLLEGVDAVVLLAGSSVVEIICVVASVVEGDSVEASSELEDVGVDDTEVNGDVGVVETEVNGEALLE